MIKHVSRYRTDKLAYKKTSGFFINVLTDQMLRRYYWPSDICVGLSVQPCLLADKFIAVATCGKQSVTKRTSF